MSINQHAHPPWCDPRVCQVNPGQTLDHRAPPMTWKVNGDDRSVSVGLSRLDGLGPFPHRGEVLANLTLFEVGNTDRVVDSDLSAADARLLAAALLCAAEQLESLVVR